MAFFSNIAKFFSISPTKANAHRLYAAIVSQSRRPVFYSDYAVPDTLDGRFEMILLHSFLVLHRLKQEKTPQAENFSRLLIEALFDDMDRSIREMGAGDTGVGRRVKAMANALYGRLQAYETALVEQEALEAALTRNLYGTTTPQSEHLQKMVSYMLQTQAELAQTSAEQLQQGILPASQKAA